MYIRQYLSLKNTLQSYIYRKMLKLNARIQLYVFVIPYQFMWVKKITKKQIIDITYLFIFQNINFFPKI